MTVWAVVPARLGGRRLPNKALASLGGRPLVVHVAHAAARAAVDRVVVATDSDAIQEACEAHGVEVVRTGGHPCGTHRVAEAVAHLDGTPDHVVNVQGDQPLLVPAHVDAAVALLGRFEVATVACPLADPASPSRVKVAVAPDGRALYFSRAPIPHGGPYRLHLGVYAFRHDALGRCVAAPRHGLATSEDLEQLAWLEAGIVIGVADVSAGNVPVDEEADLERVRDRWAPSGEGG